MGKNLPQASRATAVCMDTVLAEVGHFGWYQFRLFAMVLLPVFMSSIYNAQYVFTAGDLNYRCFVPECENPPGNWKPGVWEEWALISGSSCTRRKPIGGKNNTCKRGAFSKSTQLCDAWVYESNNTIVAEFNLACKDWKRTLVGTIHSIGVLAALSFIGIVSDSIGRRTTFILASVCGPVMGMIRSFVNSYTIYMIFEFLDATLGAGAYCTGFVLVVEMVGTHKRVFCGSVLASIFALGLVLLAAVAWMVPYWRTLTQIIYAPSFFFVFYFFCLSESVRWLLSKKKTEEAIKVLKKVAAMNNRQLSFNTIKCLTESVESQEEIERNTEQRAPAVWRQVLGSRILITRAIICSSTWVTVTLVYYGLSINSVSLMGNMYINFMLTALVEIPGNFLSILCLDRFGRKTSIMASLLVCGCLLITIPLIPSKFSIFPNLLAKGFISMTFVSIYIFTMELFPTNARQSLMSMCSLIGRIGSITAPLSPLLLKVAPWLPYVIFGTISCLASLLLLLTPETLRKPLPETIIQAEQISFTPQLPPDKKAKRKSVNDTDTTNSNTFPSNSPPGTSSAVTPSTSAAAKSLPTPSNSNKYANEK